MISAEQLQEIKARCDAATPGPWQQSWVEGADGAIAVVDVDGDVICDMGNTLLDEYKSANFIAHARADIPALIAEVERLQELAEALKDLSQCETNYRLTGEEIRDWEKLEGKATERLTDALVKFLSERCDLINRIVALEKSLSTCGGVTWEAEKEVLRKRLCGSICHGDDFACFYQGGDTWNPCPLATEEDKQAFLATVTGDKDETAEGGAQ